MQTKPEGSEETDKAFEIMRALDEEMRQQCEAQANKDAAVLEHVRGMLTADVFKQLEDELAESGAADDFQIVESPIGEPQDNGFKLGDIYIDQSGGVCGDDFHGTVSLPLPDGRYFQFCFSC